MLVSTGIVGCFDAAHHTSGTVDFVDIPWAEAGKRLLRRRTKGGLDFAISLEHSQYLFHGAILLNSCEQTVVVSRPKEPALIIDFSEGCLIEDVIRQAALIGHAFGNQHVPIEVAGRSILAPVLTNEDVMARTVHDLKLGKLSLRFDSVRLGTSRPLMMTRHAHG
jgi:urease accessory protein